MSRTAQIITAISTIGCAIGIGYVMQSGDVAEARYGSGELVPLISSDLTVTPVRRSSTYDFITSRSAKPLAVTSIKHTSANTLSPNNNFTENLLLKASIGAGPVARNGQENGMCPVMTNASPLEAAMVMLFVEAPCLAGTKVTISHHGLSFTDVLSADGTLNLMIPALSKQARFTVFFMDGNDATAEAQVDAAMLFNRVAVHWRGDSGVQVHAREFGADYGEPGHVWAGAARDASAVFRNDGGFLTALGNLALSDGVRAEVYTFPSTATRQDTAIDLTIEAEVTGDNCAKRIQATALQFIAGKRISAQELQLSMPDCDSVGSFLVLNNLLQNLTVASK